MTEDEEYEFLIRRLQTFRILPHPFAASDSAILLAGRLRKEWNGSGITLVLGAGVSQESDVPDWPSLVSQLITAALEKFDASDLTKHLLESDLTEIRKIRFLESHSRAFRLYIRDCLYEKIRDDKINISLDALAKFIKNGRAIPRTQTIITYNFDDLLEKRLQAAGLHDEISSIYSERTYRDASGSIQIYHPHGYIPQEGSLVELLESMIVFSERQYHREYFSQALWNSAVQVKAFTSSTCLFIGFSFSDANVRRLLDFARTVDTAQKTHIAIIRRSKKSSDAQTNNLTDYLTERDLESLGVAVLWIREYEEIPQILDSIQI